MSTIVSFVLQLLTTNECASNPCQNGATCVDTYNGYFCRCTQAFQVSLLKYSLVCSLCVVPMKSVFLWFADYVVYKETVHRDHARG